MACTAGDAWFYYICSKARASDAAMSSSCSNLSSFCQKGKGIPRSLKQGYHAYSTHLTWSCLCIWNTTGFLQNETCQMWAFDAKTPCKVGYQCLFASRGKLYSREEKHQTVNIPTESPGKQHKLFRHLCSSWTSDVPLKFFPYIKSSPVSAHC